MIVGAGSVLLHTQCPGIHATHGMHAAAPPAKQQSPPPENSAACLDMSKVCMLAHNSRMLSRGWTSLSHNVSLSLSHTWSPNQLSLNAILSPTRSRQHATCCCTQHSKQPSASSQWHTQAGTTAAVIEKHNRRANCRMHVSPAAHLVLADPVC